MAVKRLHSGAKMENLRNASITDRGIDIVAIFNPLRPNHLGLMIGIFSKRKQLLIS